MLLEWVTPELTKVLQQNEVLANGLQSPKCMAAMQLMQRNPEEAKARFGNDPEVNAFLKEFGRVMGEHFTALGQKEDAAAPAQSTGSSTPKIVELDSNNRAGGGVSGPSSSQSSLGPLAEDVLKRQANRYGLIFYITCVTTVHWLAEALKRRMAGFRLCRPDPALLLALLKYRKLKLKR